MSGLQRGFSFILYSERILQPEKDGTLWRIEVPYEEEKATRQQNNNNKMERKKKRNLSKVK